jgi:hypothetical protein
VLSSIVRFSLHLQKNALILPVHYIGFLKHNQIKRGQESMPEFLSKISEHIVFLF